MKSSIDCQVHVRLLRSHFSSMEMHRVSRINNSSSFIFWLLKLMMLGHTNIDGRVDLITPLDHDTIRSSTDIRELDLESGFVCLFRVK